MLKLLSIFLLGFLFTSCNWISLAYHALAYETTSAGEVGNVVALGSYGYATMAEQGLGIVDLNSGKQIKVIQVPTGSESIDDLAIDQNLLFVLDAKIPGNLSVYSLTDPLNPKLVSNPTPVPVEPFSGVSAGGGLVMVSGGTSKLTLRTYDSQGILGTRVMDADLGRGQPDTLVSPLGTLAFISTHYSGSKFGLSILKLEQHPLSITLESNLDLPGAGFTEGGYKPANFPIEMALFGQTLLVAHSKGIAFVDIQDPKNPKLTKIFPLDFSAVNVDVFDQTAAVVGASATPKVILINLTDPMGPKIIKTIPLPAKTHATGVALTSTKVIVAAQEKGTLVFNR